MIKKEELINRQGRVPYEYILDIFSKEEPLEMAELSRNEYDLDNQRFTIKFMGKNYFVDYPQGSLYNEDMKEIESYAVKIMFLRYLVNSKGIQSFNKDITFKDIPGGHVYYSNFYNRTILRLAKIYANNLERLKEDIKNIDYERINSGDFAFRFEFFNDIYFTFILWEKDDEFPSNANVLFDENTKYYFNAEDLAVVVDIAIECLKNNGNIPVDLWMSGLGV